MREITFAEATREAMEEEMARDPRVFLMGEDIAKQGGFSGSSRGCRSGSAWRGCGTPPSVSPPWWARPWGGPGGGKARSGHPFC